MNETIQQTPHVAELIKQARECHRRKDLAGALDGFEAAASINPGVLEAQLGAAIALREMGRADEAEIRFRELIERFPQSPVPRIGLAQALRQRRAWNDALDQYEAALRVDPLSYQAELGTAETLIALDRIGEAECRLQALTTIAPSLAGVWASLAEIYRRRCDFAGALALLESSAAHVPEHPAIQRWIGRMQMQLGRLDDAEITFRKMLDRNPEEIEALRELAELAVRQRNLSNALGWLGSAERASPGHLAVKLRIHGILCELKRFEAAEEVLERIRALRPDSSEFWTSSGQLERYRGRYEIALEHFSKAIARAPDNHEIRFSVVDVLIELARTAEVEAELRQIEQLIGPDDPRLQSKMLDYLCRTLRFDDAMRYAARWERHEDVPQGAVAHMIGLYATLERWSDVFEFFRERIASAGWAERFESLGRVLLRAARKTRRYSEARELLAMTLNRTANAEVAATLRQVESEIELLEQLGLDVDPAWSSLKPAPDAQKLPTSIGTVLRSFARSSVEQPILEVFTCTDGNYLIGAAVCIFSLLRYNLSSAREYRISVFCADEALAAARTIFKTISAAFCTPIKVRAATSVVSAETSLRRSWGLFTQGMSMAPSAYHRIYAARRLLEETSAQRAIYLDADTCVRGGFDRFVDLDLQGQALGARLEDPNDRNVRRAASILKVSPEHYFNSGVLALDLRHPDLKRLLDRTIEIVEHEQDKITFHDQCALNLAFREQFTPLPEYFNHFAKPGIAEVAGDTDPIVAHFSAYPKPWDPVSEDPKRLSWLEECAALAQVVGVQNLRKALALGYGTSLTGPVPTHTLRPTRRTYTKKPRRRKK
jgi:lipopolysaccharide biosynthesis glycosyltransferase/predicted Zn-dependent protease